MSENNVIYFIVDEPESELTAPIEDERGGRVDTAGGWNPKTRQSRVDALACNVGKQRISMKAEVLKRQMQDLRSIVNDLFTQDPQTLADQTSNGLQLQEVSLSVQVNAKGELSVLGSGGAVGAAGGITLKFTKPV